MISILVIGCTREYQMFSLIDATSSNVNRVSAGIFDISVIPFKSKTIIISDGDLSVRQQF